MNRIIISVLLLVMICMSVNMPAIAKDIEELKLRIAVLDIEPKANGSNQVSDSIREMLITAIVNSKKFDVVERGDINKVLKEQDFNVSGRVTPESAAKIGKLLGAQALILGAITEYANYSNTDGVLVGPIAIAGNAAKLAIDIRIIDATNGQIISAQNAEGKSISSVVGGGGKVSDIPVGGVLAQDEPMSNAARNAVSKAVNIITEKIGCIRWYGRIVKRDGKFVYINCGEAQGIHLGETFTVYSKGEDLIDPETGQTLGSVEKEIGKIIITEIKEKYSIASIQQEDNRIGSIGDGDIIR